jgi:hypothetical protein
MTIDDPRRGFLLLLALGAASFGCSSAEFVSGPVDDVGADAGDAAPEAPAETLAPVDSDAPFKCRGPEDCGGKLCCANLELGAGTPPACPLLTGSSECKATCETVFPLSCPAKGVVRVCHKSTDCAGDVGNPFCCKILGGGVAGTVCISAMIKSYALECY